MLKSILYTLLFGRWSPVIVRADDKAILKMRRWKNGAWEYREPTDEELEDILWWQAVK